MMRNLLVMVLAACGSEAEPTPTRDIPCDQVPEHVAKVDASAIDKTALVVHVDSADKVVINNKTFEIARLDDLFRAFYLRDHAAQVVIEPSSSVPRGIVLNIMERAKNAGLTRLAISAPP